MGHTALENLDFDIARLAFIKLQDYIYLELINDLKVWIIHNLSGFLKKKNIFLQERQKKGEMNKDVMLGDILAHRGKFKEAARLYQKAGQEHKALSMYTDLRMFDLAQVRNNLAISENDNEIFSGIFGFQRQYYFN